MSLNEKIELDLCSAKDCREAATWQLLWNNPKVHTPERRKIWLACDEHKSSLGSFLTVRGFLKETQTHTQPTAS